MSHATSARTVCFDTLEKRTLLAATLLRDSPPNDIGTLDMADVNGTLFYAGLVAGKGWELFRSDGTPSGTRMLKDISPGKPHSRPEGFVNAGGLAFFVANDGVHGREIWVSDGMAPGTFMVKDLVPGNASFEGTLYAYGSRIAFEHDGGLWISNGSPAGTKPVKDIDVTSEIAVANGLLFFTADDGSGEELWRSDGTTGGTFALSGGIAAPVVMLDDFERGTGGSQFFFTTEGEGSGLWMTDGSVLGTSKLKDFSGGVTDAPLKLGSSYVFTADDGSGWGLWKTNATSAGTVKITNITTSPARSLYLVRAGSNIFFTASSGDGTELWKTDGSAGETHQVANIQPGGGSSDPDLADGRVGVTGGTIYFAATTSDHGRELWKSNGTEGGTVLVQNTNAGGASGDIGPIAVCGESIFFIADDGSHGDELFAMILPERPPGLPEPGTPSANGAVSGQLFNDLDADGVQDAGEVGIEGWTVWYDKNLNGQIDMLEPTRRTNAEGNYSFTSLPNGINRIQIQPRKGWRQTGDRANYDVLNSGTTIARNRNFAFTQRVKISGTVFADKDTNGEFGTSELGMTAWKVFIDTDRDGELDVGERSVVASTAGKWSFIDLLPNESYQIRVVVPNGYTLTAPSAGLYEINLRPAKIAQNINFGAVRIA